VLDRAHARGIDVRVIFWRHLQYAAMGGGLFAGTDADRRMLAERGSRFLARWDQAHGRYCQHQKSWLIDAGEASEVSFVGGINLGRDSLVPPGHPPSEDGNTHDVYVELRGPSATDVHHNFVQRWNEASDRGEADGCWPDALSQDVLAFPVEASAPAGEVPVQIQRTVRRDRYRDATAAPGAEAFEIERGEHSVVEQYRDAIDAAQRSIYIEDQAIGAPEIVDRLKAALERGVEVVFLVPKDAYSEMATARGDPKNAPFWDSLAALGDHQNFTLAGIVTGLPGGGYQSVYVHAKVALIDDAWCTIGSANIGNRSFYGDTELNASFWHAPTVRDLRVELLAEHLALDTSGLDDVAALREYACIARENAARYTRDQKLEGLALALDPATYGS
jgi:phosphatidylserine/phosphatidylglycerophosphate/cardiolipin synthase-like enzyme